MSYKGGKLCPLSPTTSAVRQESGSRPCQAPRGRQQRTRPPPNPRPALRVGRATKDATGNRCPRSHGRKRQPLRSLGKQLVCPAPASPIDFRSKLTSQLPEFPVRVVYTKSGTCVSAAIPGNVNAIIDRVLSEGKGITCTEGLYICAIPSSPELAQLARPLMSFGKDEHRIDKHIADTRIRPDRVPPQKGSPMAMAPAEAQVVWWHSISCVCRRCLEHDLFASVIESWPTSWQILPADGNNTPA